MLRNNSWSGYNKPTANETAVECVGAGTVAVKRRCEMSHFSSLLFEMILTKTISMREAAASKGD